MNWSIAEAKQRFSELVKAAGDEPQWIYNRDKVVAAMVPAPVLKEFLAWHEQREGRTVGDAFAELRRLCAEDDYPLEIPPRQDRSNSFPETLDELSR